MAFGTEAVILVELKLPSARVVGFNEQHNPQDLKVNLNLLEEKREEACIRMAVYRWKVVQYYNSRVRGKTFRVGDLVLRRAAIS